MNQKMPLKRILDDNILKYEIFIKKTYLNIVESHYTRSSFASCIVTSSFMYT